MVMSFYPEIYENVVLAVVKEK